MTALPIAFKTNVGKYNFLGTTRLINCYAEQQGKDAKGPLAVLQCDGSVLFSAVTDTPIRGAIYMDDLDVIYEFHSSSVWKVTSAGTATRIGVIPGIDRVQPTRNQKATPQITVKCGAGTYCIESDVVTRFTLPGTPTVISVDTLAGYTIFGTATGKWFISAINETMSVDALDFATAEQSPDKLKRAFVFGGDLLLMGTNTIEPWANTGNADFPFELRSSSAVQQKGLLAADSPALCDNTVMFIGHDGIVYRLGAPPQRISNGEVERAIRDDADQASIVGTSWTRGGHAFYSLTGSTWTYAYDAATQTWHKRESYQSTRWRHDVAITAWGKVILGDRNSGSTFYLDSDTATEASSPIIWGVDSPPMTAGANGGVVDAIWFDVLVGSGLVSPTAQGYDPLLMLSYSNDGGNIYSSERLLKLGKRGKYKTRIKTHRLGRFGEHGRTWRLRKSDPVPMALVGCDARVRQLARP